MKMFCKQPFTACLMLLLGVGVSAFPLSTALAQPDDAVRGLPGRREGAGTRGGCMQGQTLLTPLAPLNKSAARISNRPTFLWYVPASTARTAEFTLMDERDKALYSATLKLPGKAGVVKFSPPANAVSSVLERGKKYYWQFSLICDPNQPSKNPFVEGVVLRG